MRWKLGDMLTLRYILELELAERLDMEGSEREKRGSEDEVLVWGTNVWVAGSVSFAEIGKIRRETRILFGSGVRNPKLHCGHRNRDTLRHLCVDINGMLELWEEMGE